MEKKTGLDLVDLAKGSEDVKINYADLQANPEDITIRHFGRG